MGELRTLKTVAFGLVILLALSLVMPAPSALAGPPAMPPRQTPTPEPNPVTQVINQIVQFPFENLSEALQNALESILNNSIAPLEGMFSASIGRWLTSSPGIITPGGGIANGADVMGPAWRLMIKIAVLLWPLTLAILAAVAAKDAVAAASWGIGDLKETLAGWLLAVLASATSLYWMDLANRFTNATTMAILDMSFTGEAGFQPNALTTLVFGTAGVALTVVALPASLIIVVFIVLLGLAVLSALIFQFLARFVILYVLVALAPVVIILGVLPPLGWFRAMWLRGLVMVEAIGPINALLLKLVMILAGRGGSNDPIAAFVDFIGAIGVLSILLTVDGVIIRGVFGAAEQVMQKAVGTVTALATLALAGVTALAGGSIAAGAMGAAGSVAAGGSGAGGAAGAGGAFEVPPAATGLAGAGAGARTSSGAASPASAARSAFQPGAAWRGAGDVLLRQPGMLGSFGAAMRSMGSTLQDRERNQETVARWQAGQAPSQAWREEQNAHWSNGGRSHARIPRAEGSRGTAGLANPPPVGGNGPSQGGPNPPPDTGRGTAAAQTGGSPAPTVPSENESHGAAASPASGPLPPPQSPSVSPMGTPLAPPATPGTSLAPEAANQAHLLPAPLGERARAFASLYADPRQQAAAARAAVDAFNQMNAQGQHDVGFQTNAWDRSMTPVIASARQGLPLETMAHDAGFGGNISGFLAQRMLDASHRELTLQVPAQPIAWHPQLAPHDWDMGTAIAHALGNRISQGAAARVYHEVRSPETGGGWTAGAQFLQTVQEIFQRPPADPIAVLSARLIEMEARGSVSPRATSLWRANAEAK